MADQPSDHIISVLYRGNRVPVAAIHRERAEKRYEGLCSCGERSGSTSKDIASIYIYEHYLLATGRKFRGGNEMGFWDEYEETVPDLPGFASKEEKQALIDKGTTFSIVAVREGEVTQGPATGPRFFVDIDVKLPGSRKTESRTLSFGVGQIESRDNTLLQMKTYLASHEGETISAALKRAGRAILLVAA